MLKRHHRFFQSLQVMRDAVLAVGAFYLAYLLRFNTDLIPDRGGSDPNETIAVALMILLVWPVVGWFSSLYVSHRTQSAIAEVFDVFRTTVISFLLLVTVTYFVRDVRYSRATLLLWATFSFFLVSGARTASRIALGRLRARGYNLRHVVVVGTGDLARTVVGTIEKQTAMGMRVVGMVALDRDEELIGGHVNEVPVIARVSEIQSVLASRPVDQVIVALPIDDLRALRRIMAILSLETVDVRLVPDLYQYATLCGSIEEFSGLPIINLQATVLMGWNAVSKRVFDVLVSGLGLILVSPIMLGLAILIKLESSGPVFFTQLRGGIDGGDFKMYKFRTMRDDAETHGTWTVENDPRRTRLGTWLRKLSLDELPQLWNVLKGDMSLVGPRPEQPALIEDFKREIPRYALRHKIKSGMTGWAQVNGLRGDTSIAKRIELDLYYIENWSLLLDLKILMRTVFGGFLSPNAY